MRINKQFTPITIELETLEDRDFFLRTLDTAIRSSASWYFRDINKSTFQQKLEYLREKIQ